MAYPEGGFNSAASLALTTDQGGPLSVTGADANGALKMIAKAPNVRFQLANGASTVITVTRGSGNTDILLTCAVASITAAVAARVLLADAQTKELIDVAPSGTGAGLVAAFAQAAVPFVRIYGIAGGECDNTGSSTDLALEYGSAAETVLTGKFLFPVLSSPVAYVPQRAHSSTIRRFRQCASRCSCARRLSASKTTYTTT